MFRLSSMPRKSSRMQTTFLRLFSTESKYQFIEPSVRGKVGLITLNRPKQLNALCAQLISELNEQVKVFDANSDIGAMVITGNERAFAAGADIGEMSEREFPDTYVTDMLASWNDVTLAKKPIIAAVNGFALGGGCELAMMCDIIIAGEKAKFGQPEVKIGTIPGCGGTQRLIRSIGKSKAMEMVLTGNMMNAQDALQSGLVCRVVPPEELVDQAIEMGENISSLSQPIIQLAKEAVNSAYETTLSQGVVFERRLFHSTFATNDQKEGMRAFKEKREPNYKHE